MYDFANYRDDIIILILVFLCMIAIWYLSKDYELKIFKKNDKNKISKIKEEINAILKKEETIDEEINKIEEEIEYKVEDIETLAKNNLMDSPFIEDFTEKEERVDDLTLIEGIGPKIKELLYKNNIKSFEKLSRTNELYLQNMLDEAGNSFNMANPKTWPEQARLAYESRWEELDEYQNELYGGL